MNDLKFPGIYETFQPKILRYLTRLIGEAEAEDLTQEVLIKVNDGLPDHMDLSNRDQCRVR
jgi:DNA-directed RNA polymerase specialized sigma24 family protein